MLTSLFEILSSVFTMGLGFFILFLLPWFIIILAIVSCVKRKKDNKPIKKRILISSILELISIVLIFVLYYNIEDSKFLFLVVFLCGGFSLLIILLIALPIVCIYRNHKKRQKTQETVSCLDES